MNLETLLFTYWEGPSMGKLSDAAAARVHQTEQGDLSDRTQRATANEFLYGSSRQYKERVGRRYGV
jgi:hypothetical protein